MKKLILVPLLSILYIAPSFAMTDTQLEQGLVEKLTVQLEDKPAAEYAAKFILNQLLTWKGKELSVNQADSILAYSFGNRVLPNGNQTPGPMNQELANTVVEIYKQTGKPVYAQWEIATAIGKRIPSDKLFYINPVVNSDGSVTYLSTIGVAEEAVKLSGGDLGKTIVVAFYEHSLRAIDTSKEFGIEAYAPKEIELPHHYDAQSGQAWTRDKNTFIMHEISNRSANERTKLIEGTLTE
ncbi:hypothetical protein [Vibrio marisflavi]|uniref:Uncharacterized protein n=1 Tax=Vibrio marisflavi CECT 7928 TaxID=634439 RepID=A0ABM8ZZN3_9VIBR|nr:hypothetical protein [Vibrio marisflavi]CAH0536553.1 hypothetical protein VMF7928_00506 [Vibrio marisflavi CECT 7928]